MPNFSQTAPCSRRHILKSAISFTALSAVGALPAGKLRASNLTVGFIYVGSRRDFGFNQAHAEGAAALRALPGVTVMEEENVAETVHVRNSMESMIRLDGASLLFPTSFGYFDPHILNIARRFPEVRFQHFGSIWSAEEHPANVGSYRGHIGTGQYLNGIAAAHATRSKRLGFVAAKPIPQVLLNINAFLLGARTVDPAIICQVIFTGEWSSSVREAEATNALINQGCDVITCHVDAPKVVMQTAVARDCFICGYHADQSALGPSLYLTGAEWNWGEVYTRMVQKHLAQGGIPNLVAGGLAEGFVRMSPLGPALSDGARRHFAERKAKVMQGDYAFIRGPLHDNRGNLIAARGDFFVESDTALEKMDYLVEGIFGASG